MQIFESKGDTGIFCNTKKQITVPWEFNFAVDKRIPPPTAVVDHFDKVVTKFSQVPFVLEVSKFVVLLSLLPFYFSQLSICSESQRENHLPRNTTPNPFHLHTEERGAEKERRIAEELMQKQLEEERARIPRAHPYPYTTDYPVVCIYIYDTLFLYKYIPSIIADFDMIFLSVADSTTARAEAMHKARAF